MSGGSYEYVMGMFANNNGNPIVGKNSSENSGFNGLLNDGTSYTSGINFPERKYYDLYTSMSSTTACNGEICYGHALSETANWYNDFAYFVNFANSWFRRGGYYNEGISAGVFNSYFNDGAAEDINSWRSVLVV